MKAKNLSVWGGYYEYRYPSYQLIGKTTSTSWNETVTPGTLVHGNFRDPNNWSYTIHQEMQFRGAYLWHNGGPSPYTSIILGSYGNTSWAPGKPAWNRSLVYNRALEKLNSKVRGGLDLAVDLAEGGQTMRMIRAVARVKRWATNPRNWSTKDIANGWLQWQYGWRPLLSDVYEAADDTQRKVRKALTHVVGSCTMPNRRNDRYNGYQIDRSTPCSVVRRGDGRQACRIVLTLTPREDTWDFGQWSSLNPVSLAWELIPYSFVVDWFVDVGSYLRNLETALLYGKFVTSGYVSELYAYEGNEVGINQANGYATGNGSWSTAWTQFLSVKAKIRHIEFARSTLSSYPLPRLPTFKVALGSQRLFSAASLLRQLLK